MNTLVRQRRMKLHFPMKCIVCKKEIAMGQKYTGRTAYEKHSDCL